MHKITLSPLNSRSIDILIDELANATGMKFEHYQRKFLEKRISFRMKRLNLQDHQEYIKYLKNNPNEVDLFLDKFTINYTYFFRNYNVFENFGKFIKIYAKNLKRPLRIWSAPCATGEEPYSIAIILDKLKKENKDFPQYQIVASDIDPTALKFAKNATYGEYSLHDTPEFYLKSYFFKQDTNIGPKYILKKEIKENVEFIQEDIINGHKKDHLYDVIFCRNLFIYISQYAREKLLRVLESKIYNGGLLILGGSETLKTEKSCFEILNIRDRFYVKKFSTKTDAFKNRINRVFKVQKEKEKPKSLERTYKESIKTKITQRIEKIKEEVIKIENETEKQLLSPQIRSKKEILEKQMNEPTEVRITGILVNNGMNKTLVSSKNKNLTEKVKFNGDKIETSFLEKQKKLLNQKEEELRKKETILKQQEELIKERTIYLSKKKKRLDAKKKQVKNFLRYAKEEEKEVEKKWKVLEELTKQVEQRDRLVIHREKQLQKRISQLDKYSQQIIQREIQKNIYSQEIEHREKDQEIIHSYEKKRFDRILNSNSDNEIVIPMGYYALINSFDNKIKATKFSIQGLGSGIGLILKDPINNIFAMSNIPLPNSSAAKQGYHLIFPHTFIDTSIQDLYNNLLYQGAKKANIRACIIGGAKLFSDYDKTYQENIDCVKKGLSSMHIKIESEDIGGLSERSVIYDTINDALYVKKTWEFQYRLIT
ncbi:MAG: CheR family methyltransferase [Promethearchaeota archaeon]